MNHILIVDGITCKHCVDTIKEAVEILDGVLNVDVDIEQKKVSVELDEKITNLENLRNNIEELGFEVMM